MLHVAFSPADPEVIYFPFPIALIKLAVQREIHHKQYEQEMITVQRKTVSAAITCIWKALIQWFFCIRVQSVRWRQEIANWQIHHENFAPSPTPLCCSHCPPSFAPSYFPSAPDSLSFATSICLCCPLPPHPVPECWVTPPGWDGNCRTIPLSRAYRLSFDRAAVID